MWVSEMKLQVEDMQFQFEDALAPTLYGLGGSIEEWAGAVLNLAGAGPLVVVGSSIGGSCALEMTRLAPDRVAALVMVGAKAGHRPEPELRDEVVRALENGGMGEAWPRYWRPLFGAGARPSAVEVARTIAFNQDIGDVVRGVQAFHNRSDRTAVLSGWPKRLVVVSGDHDRFPGQQAMATSSAKGEFRLVSDAGHYVNLEQPKAVEDVLRRLVQDLTGTS
jgi:pimeloyl-ACP methyl ester carboxylesterase